MSETTISAEATVNKPRKRKRVFMWTFLVIQAVFVAWMASGLSAHTGATAADITRACANGQWRYVFSSYQDCATHYPVALNDAGNIGKGIGAALVIGLWVAVDVILGVGRLVVVFARKGK